MHVVIDAFAVRSGSSAVILENLLAGWRALAPDDTLTVVAAEQPPFALAEGVRLELVEPPVGGKAGAVWNRTVAVRRAVRRLGADALLSGVTASAFLGARVPRGVILTDLRHELRPQQFSRKTRLARRVAYGWSFRFADGVFCISGRTRDDLLRTHAYVGARAHAAPLGSDHADRWPEVEPRQPYAVAFGHFANKNVDTVLDAWAEFVPGHPGWTLRLVGMGRADREASTARVADLGISDHVELMPWLDDEEFVACFAGAGLVILPSDFEGFGLPAVEALRRRIPVVVSADPALVEVTGGHAEVVADLAPAELAAACDRAIRRTEAELDAGRAFSEKFTWRAMAEDVRRVLLDVRM